MKGAREASGKGDGVRSCWDAGRVIRIWVAWKRGARNEQEFGMAPYG